MAQGIVSSETGEWFNGTNTWLAEAERDSSARLNYCISGDFVNISLTTASKGHAENDVIFTIPQEYKPKYPIRFVVFEGNESANLIAIDSATGIATLWVTQTGTARLTGCVTYPYNAN